MCVTHLCLSIVNRTLCSNVSELSLRLLFENSFITKLNGDENKLEDFDVTSSCCFTNILIINRVSYSYVLLIS
jgi:hypothetical protein